MAITTDRTPRQRWRYANSIARALWRGHIDVVPDGYDHAEFMRATDINDYVGLRTIASRAYTDARTRYVSEMRDDTYNPPYDPRRELIALIRGAITSRCPWTRRWDWTGAPLPLP